MSKNFFNVHNHLLLKVIFSIAIVILLLATFFSYETNRTLVYNATIVDHTNTVIGKINALNLNVKDAQLFQATYLIDNNELLVMRYQELRKNFTTNLVITKLLTSDNPNQDNLINELQNVSSIYFEKLNELIRLKKNKIYVSDPFLGKAEANQLLIILDDMKSLEQELLSTRKLKFESSISKAPLYIIIFSLVALFLAIIICQIIYKNIKTIETKEKNIKVAYEEVQALNEEFVSSNEELRAINEELDDSKNKISIANVKLLENEQIILKKNIELQQNFDTTNLLKIALEEHKNNLNDAQELANVGSWELNAATNEVFWSDQFMRLFEFNPIHREKFSFDVYKELFHPEDREMVMGNIQNLIENHQPYILEHRIVRKNGEISWFLAKATAVINDEGKVIKFAGTSLDITCLKKAQTEEEKLIAIVNNSSDFVGLSDMNGKAVFLNPAGKSLIGFKTSQNIKDSKFTDFYSSQDKELVLTTILPQLIQTGSWSGEINFTNFETDASIAINLNIFYVKDKTGLDVGIAYRGRDLTAEKKVAEELHKASEEMSAAMEELYQAEENLVLINKELEYRVAERSKALVVSEERFRIVSLATNDAIWDWDIQTDYLWWNEGFKNMFGYKFELLEPGIVSLHNRIHPDDKDRIVKQIRKFLVSGKSQWNTEYRFLNASDEYIYVMERGYAIFNELGRPYRMVGSLINISERKKFEDEKVKLQELAETQRSKIYELLMNIPASIMIMKGEDLIIEMANNQYQHYTDSQIDIIGKSRKNINAIPNSANIIEKLEEVYRTGIPFKSIEFADELNNNGISELAYFNVSIIPIYNTDNKIDGIITFAVEVTELVLSKIKVQESAQRVNLMLEAIPQMTWISDKDGLVAQFNSKWYDFTGATPKQLLGAGWVSYLHPDDVANTQYLWNQSITTGSTYEIEHRFIRGVDKTYRWMLGRAVPIKNSAGAIINWVGTCTDIHDQKIISDDLKNKNLELIKVNELLDTFVYTAAHDLKSPVINIKGLIELVKETEDQAEKQEYYKTIDVAVQRLDDTITGLVEVIDAQSEDNKIAKLITIEEILLEVEQDFSGKIANHGATITHDFSRNKTIYYLKSYIESIFTNLVGNALKYRSENPLLVQIISYRTPEFVVLEITDNGIGIDLSKNGNKIFKAFNRFSRNAEGKGLGLYLIKTMVERNGGKLELESTLNIGTKFRLFLKEYV